MQLKDGRKNINQRHPLINIVMITLAATVAGAQTWNQIEAFGHTKKQWLASFLNLESGIPSHDTFNRFFQLLDPKAFQKVFLQWVAQVTKLTEKELISIDGKTLRGTRCHNQAPIHLISAWAKNQQVSLGQLKVPANTNELGALPQLLQVLYLKGCLVTIDAIGCHQQIAAQIIAQEGDYLFPLKKNQKNLWEDAQASFACLSASQVYETEELAHGRIDQRKYSVLTNFELLSEESRTFPGLSTLIKVERSRYHKATGKQEFSTVYYVSSCRASAQELGTYIRSHWGIENIVHRNLDVVFREDESRKRALHAAENFSLLNKLGLKLLRSEASSASLPSKRFRAALDTNYLTKVLQL